MKRWLVSISLSIALIGLFFGFFLMNVSAKEAFESGRVSYYTYIQIQPGDTLWSIAEDYAVRTDITVDEYVLRLKQMNHIGEDTIHVGHYLTVMYQLAN